MIAPGPEGAGMLDRLERVAAWVSRGGREPDGPPPPAGFGMEAVEAWARAHLQMEGWTYLGPFAGAVLLVRPQALAPRFTLDVREEAFFTTRTRDGRRFRCRIARLEVLAETRSIRQTAEACYRRSNLQKPLSADWEEDAGWFSADVADSPLLQHVRELCARAGGAPAEAPESLLQADIEAWTARTVEPGEDLYSHFDETGAVYVRPSSARRLGKGRYAIASRVEAYYPQQGAFRSVLEELELDLRRRAKRIVRTRAHPAHNLGGEPLESEIDHWVEAGRAGFLPVDFDRLARLAGELAS